MEDIIAKAKQMWERDKESIVLGTALLIGPSLLQGRGRPPKIMQLVQLAGLGILGYTLWKNRDLFGLGGG